MSGKRKQRKFSYRLATTKLDDGGVHVFVAGPFTIALFASHTQQVAWEARDAKEPTGKCASGILRPTGHVGDVEPCSAPAVPGGFCASCAKEAAGRGGT